MGAPTRAVFPHAPGGSDCFGRWPVGGQSVYASDCYGHDEPGLEPFSNLPGSGGNVTWNVTLPTDASPTQNQSDLYTAVWFGMDLTDPLAYLGQCFLELQFYPDYNALGQPQNGVWSAYAIAWEISLATGVEDACYQSNLTDGSGSLLQMNQGDDLVITMTGWQGSTAGEIISVHDLSLQLSSSLTLYNTVAGYPLDPVYLANNVQDSLPWSPGGDLPVSFAFESGHTVSDPSNSSFGGCSAGGASALDPSAPCGSYDPARWAQDTGTPWQFHPTIFFTSQTQQTASQLGFIQDFGGIAWVDPLSNGTCLGKDGSAGCSYPWFSYLGASGSLSFGATDFPGTTEDFGKYNQYFSPYAFDSAGLYFYAVQNFTPANPSGVSVTIVVQGDGSVRFLNHVVRSTTTFSELSPGSYSLNAIPGVGSFFGGYTSSGGVTIDAALTAWSSFSVTATGTISASFSTAPPPNQRVTFGAFPSNGSVSVVAGFSFAPQPMGSLVPAGVPGFGRVISQALTVAPGQTVPLAPGIYSAQALPQPGFKFTGWTSTGGVYVFAPSSNYTWFNVTGPLGHLNAHYAATPAMGTVQVFLSPRNGGAVLLNGAPVTSGNRLTLAAGAYPLIARGAAPFGFSTWTYSGSAMLTNFSSITWLQVQKGNSTVTALFGATPVVTVTTGGHGTIAINGVAVPTSVSVPVLGSSTVPIFAAPLPGQSFANWSILPANAGTFGNTTAASTTLQLHANATLNASFLPAAISTVNVSTGSGGGVRVGLATVPASATVALHLPSGVLPVTPLPLPGQTLSGWISSGGVSVQQSFVPDVYGNQVPSYTVTVRGAGSLNLTFQTQTFPVTFVPEPFLPSSVLQITLPSGIISLAPGSSVNLSANSYPARLVGGPYGSVGWWPTSNLSAVGSGTSAALTIAGSGTLYVLGAPVSYTLSPSSTVPAVAGVPSPWSVSTDDPNGPYTWQVAPDPSDPGPPVNCSPTFLTTGGPSLSVTCTNGAGSHLADVFLTDRLGNLLQCSYALDVAAVPTPTAALAGASLLFGSGAPVGFLNVTLGLTAHSPTSLNDFLEVVSVSDASTGAQLTRAAGPVGVGDPNLLVSPALPSITVALTPSDFSNGVGGLPPGTYSVAVQVYDKDLTAAGGAPLYQVSSAQSSLSIVSFGIRSPSNGTSFLAAPVTITYALAGWPAFAGALLNVSMGGTLLAMEDVRPAQAAGAGNFTIPLSQPATYTVELSVAVNATGPWYRTNVSFAIVAPPSSGSTKLTWTQIGELGGGGAVGGLLVGLLAMWLVGRRAGRPKPPPTVDTAPPGGAPPDRS